MTEFAESVLMPTNNETPHMAKIVQRNEIIQACAAINGHSDGYIEPAVTAMLDTLGSKCKAKTLSEKLLSSKPAVVHEIKSSVITTWSSEYYQSHENVMRSLFERLIKINPKSQISFYMQH